MHNTLLQLDGVTLGVVEWESSVPGKAAHIFMVGWLFPGSWLCRNSGVLSLHFRVVNCTKCMPLPTSIFYRGLGDTFGIISPLSDDCVCGWWKSGSCFVRCLLDRKLRGFVQVMKSGVQLHATVLIEEEASFNV